MDNAAFTRFEANQIANTGVPLRLKASDLEKIDAASTFTDNTNNVVLVPPGEGNLDAGVLWHKLTVPYRFEGGVEVGAALTIEAGAQLQFRDETTLSVNSKGSLTAIGSDKDPVVFTGSDETANYWKGISFNSSSSSNVLRHVEVRFGGPKNPTEGGGVTINHRASATVESSTIASCKVGIFVGSEGTLNSEAASSNRFQDVGQNIFMER